MRKAQKNSIFSKSLRIGEKACILVRDVYIGDMIRTLSSEYKCLVCGGELRCQDGTALDVNDGVTVYCRNLRCPMGDWGHGKNEKEAYGIYKEKCEKGLSDPEFRKSLRDRFGLTGADKAV